MEELHHSGLVANQRSDRRNHSMSQRLKLLRLLNMPVTNTKSKGWKSSVSPMLMQRLIIAMSRLRKIRVGWSGFLLKYKNPLKEKLAQETMILLPFMARS